jgi:type IV pilus assembly protein PilO
MSEQSRMPGTPEAGRLERCLGGGRRRFYLAMVIVLALAAGLGGAATLWLRQQVAAQEVANTFWRNEVATLDRQIVEIKSLKEAVDALLTWKTIIERLQETRSTPTEIFNFLAREVPEGLVLTEVQREGRMLLVRGLASASIHEQRSSFRETEGELRSALPAGDRKSPVLDLLRRMEARQDIYSTVELLDMRVPAVLPWNVASGLDVQAFSLRAIVNGDAESERVPAEKSSAKHEKKPAADTKVKPTPPESEPEPDRVLEWAIVGGVLLAGIALPVAGWRYWKRRRRTTAGGPSLLERCEVRMRDVDASDVTTWPAPLRLFALIEAGVLAFYLVWTFVLTDEFDQLETTRNNETRLMEEVVSKKKHAVNLDLYKEHLLEAESRFGQMLKQLPVRPGYNDVIESLMRAALGRGLGQPQLSPASERGYDFHAQMEIKMEFVGTFTQLGGFVADIGRLGRIVNLGDFRMTATPDGSSLAFEGRLFAYRMLDEAEVASRKAEKRKKQ